MKKILAGLLNLSVCDAATVQSTGVGSTRRNAIHNAMRSAIEKELGTHISAKTLVQNKQTITDEIAADSEGFISKYEVISIRTEDGLFIADIKADVNADVINTRIMSKLQKKAIIENNADSPRVAAIAYDNRGEQYPEVENEILSAMKRQGFTRTVDLTQIKKVVTKRMISAADDAKLRKTLANDFHTDLLVAVEIKKSGSGHVNLSSRLIAVNTGKIIYAGNSFGEAGMFTANAEAGALKMAARRAGFEISNAALNSAAKVERHITLLITEQTFSKIGGTLTSGMKTIKSVSNSVNDVFVRRMSGSAEFDVNFDGTATDFAHDLERAGFKILEITSDFIKI